MSANYIIKTNDNNYFCGWNQLGQICMHCETKANLAYRMSRPLAERTISKIEAFTGSKCEIVRCA